MPLIRWAINPLFIMWKYTYRNWGGVWCQNNPQVNHHVYSCEIGVCQQLINACAYTRMQFQKLLCALNNLCCNVEQSFENSWISQSRADDVKRAIALLQRLYKGAEGAKLSRLLLRDQDITRQFSNKLGIRRYYVVLQCKYAIHSPQRRNCRRSNFHYRTPNTWIRV